MARGWMWPCHPWREVGFLAHTAEPEKENDMTAKHRVARRKRSVSEPAYEIAARSSAKRLLVFRCQSEHVPSPLAYRARLEVFFVMPPSSAANPRPLPQLTLYPRGHKRPVGQRKSGGVASWRVCEIRLGIPFSRCDRTAIRQPDCVPTRLDEFPND